MTKEDYERAVGEALASVTMVIVVSVEDDFEDRPELALLRGYRDMAASYGVSFAEVAHREGRRALHTLLELLGAEADVDAAVALTLQVVGLGGERVH